MVCPAAVLPPLAPEDAAAIAAVFHCYDPPLWLVTAQSGTRRGGLIATAVMRASILPDRPRLLIALARHHHTWQTIEHGGSCAVHLIAQSDLEVVWRFGLASGHEQDKFAGLALARTPGGNPLYESAVAWLEGRVETRLDIGDRTVQLLGITGGAVLAAGAPVLTVAGLLRAAPPERLTALRQLYARDQAADTAAIAAWRRTLGG